VNNSCYIIAEAGLNHNGSLQLAKKLIDAAAIAGANAVKFQKRDVDNLAVREVLDAKDERFPSLGNTYRKIRENLEFSFEEYKELKWYTETKGINFLCTAFDLSSLEFLESLELSSYKIASHSVTNVPLLKSVAKLRKPVFLSTGMCDWEELDTAVEIFKASQCPLKLLHCVSIYPTPIEESNLKLMLAIRDRYQVPVGFSGHEIGCLATLIAVGLGACAVERHITTDKNMEGFDHKLSLDPEELKKMIYDIRLVEKSLGSGQKLVSEKEFITRRKYHVSMVSAHPIPANTYLNESMVVYKNPGTGIPYRRAVKILGCKAVRSIPSDTLLTEEMFE
jgi:sialic acid synthase SpsE